MRNKFHTMVIIGVAITLLWSNRSYAHLMPMQRGTLNLINNAAFMVLSLPLSAFESLDDNADNTVSMAEFNQHRTDIIAAINANVVMYSDSTKLILQDVIVSPVQSHHGVENELSQVTVMGKFSLLQSYSNLRFENTLYGNSADEQRLSITVTQPNDKKQQIQLSKNAPSAALK